MLAHCACCLCNPYIIHSAGLDTHSHLNDITYNTQTQFLCSNFGCVLTIRDELPIVLDDESGEGASATAATSQEGSRRASCPDTGRPLCVSLHRRRREVESGGLAWLLCGVCGGGVCVGVERDRFKIVCTGD